MFSSSHIHQASVSMARAVFPPAVSHSISFPLPRDRKKRCQQTGFSRELRAIAPASAVTDEVGKSDGQLRRSLSPQARLALASCAMFSEGTCHSAVAQVDRQMVRAAAEHERDWRSGGGGSPGGPLAIEERAADAWQLGFNRAATRGHQGGGGTWRFKVAIHQTRHRI